MGGAWAAARAGGDRFIGDFVGAIMGERKAARRAHHIISEFQIESPADDTAMPLIKHAASIEQDTTFPDSLTDSLDDIFIELFWEHVNPQLPERLNKDKKQA